MTASEARAELCMCIPLLIDWGAAFYGTDAPASEIMLASGGSRPARILDVVDTEEKIVSPMWGLQGQVDVMAKVRVESRSGGKSDGDALAVLPLELKTGKRVAVEHHAQLLLYS